jgi:hypothetical protein
MKRVEQLNQHQADVQLHEDERKQLRESLLAYIDKNPITQNPPSTLNVENKKTAPTHKKKLMMLAVVAMVVIAGASYQYMQERTVAAKSSDQSHLIQTASASASTSENLYLGE